MSPSDRESLIRNLNDGRAAFLASLAGILLICAVGFLGGVLGCLTLERWAGRQLADGQAEDEIAQS